MKKKLSYLKWTFLKWIGVYKPTPNPFHTTTYQQRISKFRDSLKDKKLPNRETEILPEILIPCYNHGKYLPYLFETLKDVTCPITIINDNSSDNTKDYIDKLGQFFKFKLINNESNLLQGGSINKAVAESKNNLFIIVNADDLMIPNWINYAIDYMKNSDVSLFSGGGDTVQPRRLLWR